MIWWKSSKRLETECFRQQKYGGTNSFSFYDFLINSTEEVAGYEKEKQGQSFKSGFEEKRCQTMFEKVQRRKEISLLTREAEHSAYGLRQNLRNLIWILW
jgi:hypothetical protein